MNLIINGFHNISQVEILNKLVNDFNFDYIHHISCDGVSIVSEKYNTTIETSLFYIIAEGNYDFSDCPPLDAITIEKMLPYEPTIIKLMDRLDMYLDKGYDSYKKRYNLYLKHLQYWNHIIKKRKIDLYVSLNIPHEVYDYVIYALCKINEIPVLFFPLIQMHDTTFIFSDLDSWQADLLPEYKRLQQYYKLEKIDNISLNDNVLREWSLRINRKSPFYMEKVWYGFKDSKTIFSIKLIDIKKILKKIFNEVFCITYPKIVIWLNI